ncbi:MAG: hypothetical protein M3N13_07115 [Candidatus Eremiobacteraeota bacterium]|nr:hypothetical protein [Candidatus Eremiobacteraeota bacterium]
MHIPLRLHVIATQVNPAAITSIAIASVTIAGVTICRGVVRLGRDTVHGCMIGCSIAACLSHIMRHLSGVNLGVRDIICPIGERDEARLNL